MTSGSPRVLTPRGALTLLASALVACAPDPWSATRESCGLAPGASHDPALLLPTEDGARHGLQVEEACAVALLEDLGADPAALLSDLGQEELGWAGHLEAVRTGAAPIDGATVTVWGMAWLLGAPRAPLDELADSPYVSPAWHHIVADAASAACGEGDTSHGLYAWVTGRITGVAWKTGEAEPGATSSMEWWSGRLLVPRELDERLGWVTEPWLADVASHTLVHEAAHAEVGGRHHVECEAPATLDGPNCDTDLTGAFGAALFAGWADTAGILDGAACDAPGGLAVRGEQNIRITWSASVMLPLPLTQLRACD